LCCMNTIQYSPEAVRYMQQVFLGPPTSSTQTASRSLQPFLQGSIGERPTDRPTDHATRSVTIGGSHSGKAKFSYCLRLQRVFIVAVDSTDRINFSNPQLYSAVRDIFIVDTSMLGPLRSGNSNSGIVWQGVVWR